MKRKSYEEKAAEGTLRLDKMRKGKAPIVTHDLPKPEAYLTKGGKKVFKAICQHLIDHEALCHIDGMYISLVAHNIDIYTRTMLLIEEKEVELQEDMKIWKQRKDDIMRELKEQNDPELYDELKQHMKSKPGDGGYFQTFPNGVVQNSPYLNVANKAFDIIEKGCRNLGMTVKSRDAIMAFAKTGEPEEDGDEFGLN